MLGWDNNRHKMREGYPDPAGDDEPSDHTRESHELAYSPPVKPEYRIERHTQYHNHVYQSHVLRCLTVGHSRIIPHRIVGEIFFTSVKNTFSYGFLERSSRYRIVLGSFAETNQTKARHSYKCRAPFQCTLIDRVFAVNDIVVCLGFGSRITCSCSLLRCFTHQLGKFFAGTLHQ